MFWVIALGERSNCGYFSYIYISRLRYVLGYSFSESTVGILLMDPTECVL